MYRQNNIEFRIASADAIGRFKAAQANSLLQVCRKEFDFGVAAREVVLLSYDRFSSWLFAVEKAFLDEELQRPSTGLMQHVAKTFGETLYGIERTCAQNPNVFTPEISDFLSVLHRASLEVINDELDIEFRGRSSKEFSRIVELTTTYLEQILIAMHEYNNNIVLKKSPFVCVSNFSRLSARFTPIKTRAHYFREHGVAGVFLLKNYTTEDLSDAVISSLEEIGIFARHELATA